MLTSIWLLCVYDWRSSSHPVVDFSGSCVLFGHVCLGIQSFQDPICWADTMMVGFFNLLGWANTVLFESDPQCLDCRFGFHSLILQGIRKQFLDGRVLQFGGVELGARGEFWGCGIGTGNWRVWFHWER